MFLGLSTCAKVTVKKRRKKTETLRRGGGRKKESVETKQKRVLGQEWGIGFFDNQKPRETAHSTGRMCRGGQEEPTIRGKNGYYYYESVPMTNGRGLHAKRRGKKGKGQPSREFKKTQRHKKSVPGGAVGDKGGKCTYLQEPSGKKIKGKGGESVRNVSKGTPMGCPELLMKKWEGKPSRFQPGGGGGRGKPSLHW